MDYQNKFCPRCGVNIQVGQRFCGNCGSLQIAMPTSTSLTAGPKKSSKKLWLGIGIPALLGVAVTIAIIAFALSIGSKDRTIMVYMIGSDLESQMAAASLDITEMENANFDPEHTKLLIYTGGTKKWALDDINAEENAIFEVSNGQITKLQTYEKSLMTNPGNLTSFINYAYDNYPADLYDLILWDHGGGPIFGYGKYENSIYGSTMKLSVLSDALANTNIITSGKKFDLIGFDACLMGSMEVANILSNYSDYMVASEETEPGNGWDYAFLDDLGRDGQINTTEDLGRSIIDHYVVSYDDYWYDSDLSMSLVNLRKISSLITSVESLFTAVKDEITNQTFSQYSRTMTREKVYGYTGRDSESYDLVDLMDLCQSLNNTHGAEVDKIKEDFDDVVQYSRSNIDNTNGLSVYFLNFNKALAEEMLEKYRDVVFSDKYYDFLVKYKGFVTGDRKVANRTYSDLSENKTADNAIEIDLPDELRDNYQSGEIAIFRKLDDNVFMPVYRSSEVELDGNKLRATSYDLQFVVEVYKADGSIEYGWSAMFEKERTANYADYISFGLLGYTDDSPLGFSLKNHETHIRILPGNNEGQVRDIRVQSESDTGLASKMNLDPDKIAFIDFMTGTYKLFSDSGELDYNFESHGVLYGSEASIEKGDTYKIKLVDLDYDFGDIYDGKFKNTKDYYAEFIVYDTQGDSHQLNLVHIN